MVAGEERDTPVRAKAFVIDPGAMTVLWVNEAAAEAASVGTRVIVGEAVERAVPLAEQLAIVPAIERVAATGEPYHVHADVIPTRRGSMVLAVSVYRLPEGDVLILVENVWDPAVRKDPNSPGRPARGWY
ncbi:MAG: PAS domain-containing protein [Coriobacteriia bacterium]|nr:PAS domain-containing protein [Coriobacteriia bacterium]MBN2839881.1 PAS domain-containing protein [Coriobacteriia bacterium]